MSINQTNAIRKSCQLAALLSAINLDGQLQDVDKANLIDLAADLSDQISTYLISSEVSQGVTHA